MDADVHNALHSYKKFKVITGLMISEFEKLVKELNNLQIDYLNLQASLAKDLRKLNNPPANIVEKQETEEIRVNELTFSNGQIQQSQVFKVDNSQHHFIYFDTETLRKKGCPQSLFAELESKRFKFVGENGPGLKYIGNAGFQVTCQLTSEQKTHVSPLLYEYKAPLQHGEWRIGCIACPSDQDPTKQLLIGCIYMKALHNPGAVESLKSSLANKVVEINFPKSSECIIAEDASSNDLKITL